MKRLLFVIATTIAIFIALNLLGNVILKAGLCRYFCLNPADVLVIGHSMSEMGIDRDLLEKHLGRSVAKYCMNGAGTADRMVMIRHYIEATGHKPKYIIYDVSARSFSFGLADNSYALFYPFFSSQVIREYLKENAPCGDYWKKRLIPLTRYDDTRFGAVIRGYRRDWKCSSNRKVDIKVFDQRLKQGDFWKISFDEENMQLFEKTLAWLDEQNIVCILVALPCLDMLNEAQPELYKKAMEYITDVSDKYSNVAFYDMNGLLSKRHELFRDPIHLNRNGQIVATRQLAEELRFSLK